MGERADERSAARPREHSEEARLRYAYGITSADRAAMVEKQGGTCAICKAIGRELVIDHDHKTTKVRALLCRTCNAGIGQLRDNADLCAAGAAYLREHANG